MPAWSAKGQLLLGQRWDKWFRLVGLWGDGGGCQLDQRIKILRHKGSTIIVIRRQDLEDSKILTQSSINKWGSCIMFLLITLLQCTCRMKCYRHKGYCLSLLGRWTTDGGKLVRQEVGWQWQILIICGTRWCWLYWLPTLKFTGLPNYTHHQEIVRIDF